MLGAIATAGAGDIRLHPAPAMALFATMDAKSSRSLAVLKALERRVFSRASGLFRSNSTAKWNAS